jgi:hypothetical protein
MLGRGRAGDGQPGGTGCPERVALACPGSIFVGWIACAARVAGLWRAIDERKADVIVRTRYDDIEQNEVLWIRPETWYLPELPGGFALRVDEFLGWDYSGKEPRRVWVRGPVLLNACGAALRTLTLCVPVDQPRAVLTNRSPIPVTPPQTDPVEPTRAVGVASAGVGAHRAERDARGTVEYAGRRYRRVL